MPTQISQNLEALQTALGQVPAALLAIVLLAGPTVGWILYRELVAPERRRSREAGAQPLWVCQRCRSASEVRHARCYRCGLARGTAAADVADVAVDPFDPSRVGAPAARSPGVAVGPGRGPAMPLQPGAMGAAVADTEGTTGAGRSPGQAVGPGKAIVSRPRRHVVADGSERVASARAATQRELPRNPRVRSDR